MRYLLQRQHYLLNYSYFLFNKPFCSKALQVFKRLYLSISCFYYKRFIQLFCISRTGNFNKFLNPRIEIV